METINENSASGSESSRAGRSGRSQPSNHLLLALGFFVVVACSIFREPLQNRIARSLTLANQAPPPELVEEMIEKASDRTAAILAAWNTRKIVHRQVAVREVFRALSPSQPLPSKLEKIVLSGALDPDMNVRETALSILQSLKHPAVPALAGAQLADPDPQIRLLGLNNLKRANARIGVPLVIPLLDDSDPSIISMGLVLLEHWSGEKFGVKLRDTVSFENEKSGLKEFRQGAQDKAKAGADRAKAWWHAHQSEFPAVKLAIPNEARAAQALPASDFSLRALDGRQVCLSDFHGKVVLINFWTTWCTACVGEIPELIALQKRAGDQLAILGVSLDFVPDSHGHIGGHAAVEEQNKGDRQHDDNERGAEALKRVREKVHRTVKTRGINYTVLLDEKNEIGGRFNGGELPTTVIIDPEGNVRRRFIGARSLPVFEALIAEAGRRPSMSASKIRE